MKKITCFIAIICVSFTLYTGHILANNHYCVQIAAYPKNEINLIWNNRKLSSFVTSRNDCIIEPRANGKFYGICCGDYSSFSQACRNVTYFKPEFPKAFARKYHIEQSQKILPNHTFKKLENIEQNQPEIEKVSQPHFSSVSSNQVPKHIKKAEEAPPSVEVIRKPAPQIKVAKVENNKNIESIPEKQHRNKKTINKNSIPLSAKLLQESMNKFDTEITRNIVNNKSNSEYEIFSLKRYFALLEKSDLDFKSSKYDSKLYLINSLIESDRYNPSLSFQAGTTVRKTYNVGNATNYASLDATAGLYFNWHIYDAQKRFYNNERKIIFKRLSELNLLSARDKLLINGSMIYLNLWYLQKIIDKYNFLLTQQEKLVDLARIKSETGDATSIYETIDTQNDYYNLEIAVSDIREQFLQQEYLFRQSINLDSPKTVYLYDPVYKEIREPVQALQKEAIGQNKELAKLQEEYKLSKSDLALAAAEKGWNFDFFSYGGYGYSTELEGTKNSGKGFEWQVGFRATYPLYNRNDTNLKISQKKFQVTKAALRVASKIKTLALTINKLYTSYKKLQLKSDIYNMQNKILKKRLDISYARYLKGEGTYKQYSDSLKVYTDSLRAKFLNDSFLHATAIQLYILSGKNIY